MAANILANHFKLAHFEDFLIEWLDREEFLPFNFANEMLELAVKKLGAMPCRCCCNVGAQKMLRHSVSKRNSPELAAGLSVRATEEACIYLKHPLMADEPNRHLANVLKSSFCGRFDGRFDDVTTDAGAVWSIIEKSTREFKRKESRTK